MKTKDWLKMSYSILLMLYLSIETLSASPLSPTTFTGEDYSYTVDRQAFSKCEFIVDSFGDAHNGTSSERWLEAKVYVHKNMLPNLVGLGASVIYLTDSNNAEKGYIFGTKDKKNPFLVTIPYNDSDPNSSRYLKLSKFNLFIDVQDPYDGLVTRYWLTKTNLTFESIFWGYKYYYVDRGNGAGVSYTMHPSPVLEAKRSCPLSLEDL